MTAKLRPHATQFDWVAWAARETARRLSFSPLGSIGDIYVLEYDDGDKRFAVVEYEGQRSPMTSYDGVYEVDAGNNPRLWSDANGSYTVPVGFGYATNAIAQHLRMFGWADHPEAQTKLEDAITDEQLSEWLPDIRLVGCIRPGLTRTLSEILDDPAIPSTARVSVGIHSRCLDDTRLRHFAAGCVYGMETDESPSRLRDVFRATDLYTSGQIAATRSAQKSRLALRAACEQQYEASWVPVLDEAQEDSPHDVPGLLDAREEAREVWTSDEVRASAYEEMASWQLDFFRHVLAAESPEAIDLGYLMAYAPAT